MTLQAIFAFVQSINMWEWIEMIEEGGFKTPTAKS